MMRIYQTLVAFSDGNSIYKIDTISYEGKLWLVPKWLAVLDEGWQRPSRIICLDGLKYQVGGPGTDYTLSQPIPRSLLDDLIPLKTLAQYKVVESPQIHFPIGQA